MNFLAHIYLSGENDLIKIGNFMGDAIKGKTVFNYDGDLQKGILLHRAIDSFTDSNRIYRESKHRLHKNFGHYSGVIMDVIYDYFLAKNWHLFSTIPLPDYINNFYLLLAKNNHLLPEKTKQLTTVMVRQNWLLSYATQQGLTKILKQMSHFSKNKVDFSKALVELNLHYPLFEKEFFAFMTVIEIMCKEKLNSL